MNFIESVQSCLKKYFKPQGRAPRSEYWYWALFVSIVSIIFKLLDIFALHVDFHDVHALYPISTIWSFAVLCPGIMVAIRRLHDTDRSGWWFLLTFTIIGVIPLIIWFCIKGTEGPNRFGHDPLEGTH